MVEQKKIPKNSLIISCQAEGDDPFNSPLGVSLFAKAAEMGGAKGIRSEGIEKTKMILNCVQIPIIGLIKNEFPDGKVRITRSLLEVKQLLEIGCTIIAIDGTSRMVEGMTGPELISLVKKEFNCIIVADISNLKEAIDSQNAGADYIATTLSGYTGADQDTDIIGPDYKLVGEIASRIDCPVIAEGRVTCIEHVRTLLRSGAWAVVIGTAITRPRVVINSIVNQMNE